MQRRLPLHWEKISLKESLTWETGVEECWKEDFPLIKENWVREHPGKHDILKSMGPARIYPQMLRELMDTIARPLTITFKSWWHSVAVTEDWKKRKCHSGFQKQQVRGPRELPDCQPHLNPWEVMEHLIPGAIFVRMGDKQVIRSSQRGYTKGKSWLANLIAFCDEPTIWIDQGRVVDIVESSSVEKDLGSWWTTSHPWTNTVSCGQGGQWYPGVY